jgi:aldehyde dehydrogenase (NAD+)
MAETYNNFIDGKWVESGTKKRFENLNPATGEIMHTFPRSDAQDVKKAVDAATNAFKKWRLIPAPKRAEILYRAGAILIEKKDEFSSEMTQEMGKVLRETSGDVQEAIDFTYYAAGEGRRMLGDTTHSELPNKFAMSVRMPIGVMAAITPWNFPMAIPSWKIMPALVAGNAIVFKPSQYTPKSAYNLVKVLEDSGLPPGVMNLVFGAGGEVGDPLLEDKRVAAISFTGSNPVGTSIAERAPKTYKRVSMELGGKNAIIILADADLDLAIDHIIWSAFGTSGQRCTAASRIIIEKPVLGELTERIVERAKNLRLGNGLDPKTEMGPVINQEQLGKIHAYTDVGKKEGAELLCGGEVAKDGDLAKGYFYKPTVFGDVKPTMRIAQEEIFGPTTTLIPVNSIEEAIEVNNLTDFGLSTGIFTEDVNKAFLAMRDIYTGIVYINAGTIGAEVHLPFGGTRGTGNGHREAGQTLLDECTEWKSIFVDYSGRLQKAQGID